MNIKLLLLFMILLAQVLYYNASHASTFMCNQAIATSKPEAQKLPFPVDISRPVWQAVITNGVQLALLDLKHQLNLEFSPTVLKDVPPKRARLVGVSVRQGVTLISFRVEQKVFKYGSHEELGLAEFFIQAKAPGPKDFRLLVVKQNAQLKSNFTTSLNKQTTPELHLGNNTLEFLDLRLATLFSHNRVKVHLQRHLQWTFPPIAKLNQDHFEFGQSLRPTRTFLVGEYKIDGQKFLQLEHEVSVGRPDSGPLGILRFSIDVELPGSQPRAKWHIPSFRFIEFIPKP